MSDTLTGLLGAAITLILVGGGLWWLLRWDRKRPGLAELRARVLDAEAVQRQAQQDLLVAEKYARGEKLTDEELLILSDFAVRAGMATPEQQQLVLSAKTLDEAKRQAAAARAVALAADRS